MNKTKSILKHIKNSIKFSYRILKENIEYTLTEAGKVSGVLALRQIANRTLHPLERLFWLLLILAAIYGVNLLTKTQIHRYAESPTVISLDRDYLDWSGPLPAVTLCYNDHLDVPKANDFIFENWNVSISDDEYFYFLEFLISIINATVTNYGDIVRFAEDERFDDFDLYDVILEVDKHFKQDIVSFDPDFQIERSIIMTEKGMCYVFNSQIANYLSTDDSQAFSEAPKPLICDYGKEQCYIKMDLFQSTGTVDVHSPYEVSESNVLDLKKGEEVIGVFKVLPVVADPKMRSLSPAQRKCVFDGDELSDFPIYSKTICLARCRAVMAYEMCNCVPFFYPYVDGPSCSPAGFECLLDFKWPNWASHICKCQDTCEELQYTVHSIKRSSWGGQLISDEEKAQSSSFRWDVLPPKVRIKRDVLFSFEDLLVSFGGTMSLFLGISILSIVKLVFFGFEMTMVNTFKVSKFLCLNMVKVFRILKLNISLRKK